MPEDSRQAGTELEITPHLIDAGANALKAHFYDSWEQADKDSLSLFCADLLWQWIGCPDFVQLVLKVQHENDQVCSPEEIK